MKYVIVFLVAIFLTSCSLALREENRIRRFTFASTHGLEDQKTLKEILNNDRLINTLKEKGILAINIYHLDSVSLILLDTDPGFNYQKMMRVLRKSVTTHPDIHPLYNRIKSSDFHLLPRIYKMEQKKEYTPEEGQLIARPKEPFKRFVMTLEINNDPKLLLEYRKAHSIGMAWPEITNNMKTVGIRDMEIYLLNYRAFLIMDAKSEFDWDTDGEEWSRLPREKEWQKHVARFQKTDPNSNAAEKWKPLSPLN